MEKEPRFTHYAWLYCVPCYWDDATQTLMGRNIVFDMLIPVLVFLHNYFVAPFQPDEHGFPIRITGEIERSE